MEEDNKNWSYIRNTMLLVGVVYALYNYSSFTTFKAVVDWLVSSTIIGIFLGFILALAALPIRRVWQERQATPNILLAYGKALGLSFLLLIGIILCLLYLSWAIPL